MWIESHQSLSRHRKTLAACAALRVDRHKLIGHLQELWWWGLDNADAGGLLGDVSDRAVAEAAGWPVRQASMFIGVLIDSGFVDRTDQGLVLHNWYLYAGKLTDQRQSRRESNRRAQSAHRQRLRQQAVSADDADNKPSTVPDLTGPVNDAAAAASPGGAGGSGRGGAPQSMAGLMSRLQRRQQQQLQEIPDEVRRRLNQPPIAVNGANDAQR